MRSLNMRSKLIPRCGIGMWASFLYTQGVKPRLGACPGQAPRGDVVCFLATLHFFVFFIAYFLLHVVVPPAHRIILIIVGSTIFYAWWRVDYVWLPYLLMFIAYAGVWWCERAPDEDARRRRLIVGLILLFMPLAIFKYAYFFAHDVLGLLFPVSQISADQTWLKAALPLGISFATFTLTAYMVDVYLGRYAAEPRTSILAGYVCSFRISLPARSYVRTSSCHSSNSSAKHSMRASRSEPPCFPSGW